MTHQPYTHQLHAQEIRQAMAERRSARRYIQIRGGGNITYCGSIVDAWTARDGTDFWKVQLTSPTNGVLSFPASRAVACSGVDGHCVCAGEPCGQFCETVPFAVEAQAGT